MKIPTFTFKNEAVWMVVISLGLPVIAAIVIGLIWLVRFVR
jgi:maltodextrin utilization protein YvdJ